MTANRGAAVSIPPMYLRAGAVPWWYTVMHVSRRCSTAVWRLRPVLETAKLNGHDPYIWLRDVLTRLPT
ncbi:TPA: transposase domain-containing protein [Serratia fonticola]